MKFFSWIPLAFVALIVGRVIYGRLRYGSWTGSFLKARIERTDGEIVLAQGTMGSQVLKVHTMKTDDATEPFVGLTVIAKAPLGASMQCFKLTRVQAIELANILGQAIR